MRSLFKTPEMKTAVSPKRQLGYTRSKSLHAHMTRISHALAEVRRAEQELQKARRVYHTLVRRLIYTKGTTRGANLPLTSAEKQFVRNMANYSAHFRTAERTLKRMEIPKNIKNQILVAVTKTHIG